MSILGKIKDLAGNALQGYGHAIQAGENALFPPIKTTGAAPGGSVNQALMGPLRGAQTHAQQNGQELQVNSPQGWQSVYAPPAHSTGQVLQDINTATGMGTQLDNADNIVLAPTYQDPRQRRTVNSINQATGFQLPIYLNGR